MKAFLILAHSDPLSLRDLIKNLNNGLNHFFIHVDLKSDITTFEKELSVYINKTVFFIQDRINVSWGGFSAVKAMELLLEAALEKKTDYDHLIFLSGNDYNIRSSKEIDAYFEKNKGVEIIRSYNLSRNGCRHCARKIQKYWFFDSNSEKNKFLRILKKLRRYFYYSFKKNRQVLINGKLCDIAYGSQWFALTEKCAKYVLDIGKNNPDLRHYFSTSMASDEMYFHTIIFNSKFISRTLNRGFDEYSEFWSLNNYTWVDRRSLSCPLKVVNIGQEFLNSVKYIFLPNLKRSDSTSFLNEKNYQELISSEYLFARKFKTGYSDELKNLIEYHIDSKT
ncbi:MAG: beta-1,6-N-acetylglucosaminyltransferase [Liquorilactobacillus hordei]|uniref:beta-1,6-N-acetylglucosaminyltransferase n=1 Tax=Liquorilactobacillus hordei TaxID=468911 RepID=UPI0039EB46A2